MKIKIIYSDRTKTIPVRFETSKSTVESIPKKPTSKKSAPEKTTGENPKPAKQTPVSSKVTKPSAPKTKYKSRAKFIKPLYLTLVIIFSALLAFSGLKIFQWANDDNSNRTQQAEAVEVASVEEVDSEGELINPPEEQDDDYWYYAKMPFYQVDFGELMAKNSDTVAFIHLNDSYVNYPVVQTSDNDYYLTHAYDRSWNDAGWVYMDYRSSVPDDNTVIYGHGRWNGTVFGTLKNALDSTWQQNKDNYAIWLSTPTENLVYQIYAIYVIPAENYYLKQTFASPEEKSAWLETMKSRNTAPIDVGVTPNDSLLTLSTCLDDFDNRVVVQAKLIKRQVR